MKSLLDRTLEIFAPGGRLAEFMEDYEPRPGQLEMAEAVAKTLAGGKLAVEAETGIGKTLAYLVPAVLSGQKVVVSTNTLNLQEQIISEAIPFIQENIDPGLSVICVKGRQNYLCLYRWEQFAVHPQFSLFAQEETKGEVARWLESTTSGDRAELPWLEDDSALWREISATASQCLGGKCPYDRQCFITELRKRAAAASLLVVNHHLLFSDLALRREGHGEVLPRYESVIFDEAHHLENVATGFFGFSFSNLQVFELARDIMLAAQKLSEEKKAPLFREVDAMNSRADLFVAMFPDTFGRFPLQEFIDGHPEWEEQVVALSDRLAHLAATLSGISMESEVWDGMAGRAEHLRSRLVAITGLPGSPSGGEYIRWYERREKSFVLTASPIDIAAELNTFLYPEIRSAVFTSATLTVGGDFSYFCERLGLDRDTDTLSLASPFDYRNRTLLYVPQHTPEEPFPQPDEEGFLEAIQSTICRILSASRGRALVLFTSLNNMKQTYPHIKKNLPYQVFVQGQAPRNKLLHSFQQQTDSVLLAVASFWEGINVPGESLSCVIIDKLPFEVPSDPVIMARMNKIREEGGNPFMDFQLPRAILALRQGVGRLIRTSSDKGLLAILDIRLFTKHYGRLFRKSLPPSPISRKFEDVESFFEE